MSARAWWSALATLVAVRVAIPLAALAASGDQLPGLPRYRYSGLTGDAYGYYAAARELIAAPGRLGRPLAAVLAASMLALVAALLVLRRRGRVAGHWALLAAVAAGGALLALAITKMHAPGAGVIGWPAVWALPLLPLRALRALDVERAFGLGLALSLAANALTVVATAYLGLRATGRRWAGIASGALFALWPLAMGAVAGSRAWGNGTWEVDSGLALYTEPLSTALVTGALALLLSERAGPWRLSAAGIAFGLGALVKLSNGVLAAVVLAVLLRRVGARRSLPFVAGALAFALPVIAYWPLGYDNLSQRPSFSVGAAGENWTESLLFRPRTLLVLVPLAVVGALTVRSRDTLALLALPVLANVVFYTFYDFTAIHPRFLFASLPPVFALWVAGVAALALGLRKGWLGRRRGATMMSGQ